MSDTFKYQKRRHYKFPPKMRTVLFNRPNRQAVRRLLQMVTVENCEDTPPVPKLDKKNHYGYWD